MRCADINDKAVNTVDMFNSRSGVWTTAALSVARFDLAATSLPNEGLAIFAGGLGASYVLMSVIAGGGVWGGGGVWDGRRVLLSQLLIADALRRWFNFCSQYCEHSHSVPCWIPLHHRFISLLSVRPRLLQSCRRPILVQLLQLRHVLQRVRSLAVFHVH
jgi:hypothetical protein